LRGEVQVMLAVFADEKTATAASSSSVREVKMRINQALTDPMFDKLRRLRRELADEENKPPFMIFSDATLHDLLRINPRSLSQLLAVSGIGQHKLARYGEAILQALHEEIAVSD